MEGGEDEEFNSYTEEESSVSFEEDLYAFLNLPKTASKDEINNAYRKFSRLYHPDKHATDPKKKHHAEILFAKVKRAHEILTDPHKRAIYDTLGTKGLETEGWEIVQRTKTPQEIREEYERIAKEREERLLQQKTNPKGVINVGVDATDIFEKYFATEISTSEDDSSEEKDEDILGDYDDEGPTIEINQMSISQSIEWPLTVHDTATFGGNLQTVNGRGSGQVSASLRHASGHRGFMEFECGAGNGLLLGVRGYRTFPRFQCFGNMGCTMQHTPGGFVPVFQSMLAKHFDKNTTGYLTYRAGGGQSSVNTTVVYQKEKNHVVLTAQVGIPTTYATLMYTRKFPEQEAKVRVSARVGIMGIIGEYGFEQKVSKHSHLSASMIVGMPIGVQLRIKVTRANQQFIFPILLATEVLPSAVLYGTIVPVVAYGVIKVFFVRPYLESQRTKHRDDLREKHAEVVEEKRREAEAAVALMVETVARIRLTEEARRGLVIIHASYGQLSTMPHSSTSDTMASGDRPHTSHVLDVTVPMQCLVKDSSLIVHDTNTKSNLPGFYDPCPGEDKQLHIVYRFKDLLHEVHYKDKDTIKMPLISHQIPDQKRSKSTSKHAK